MHYINTHIHKYMHICIYTYTHIHIYAHTHIRASGFPTKLSAPYSVLLPMNTPKCSKPQLEVVWDLIWL